VLWAAARPAAGKERFGYTQWVLGICNVSHEILELGGRTGAGTT